MLKLFIEYAKNIITPENSIQKLAIVLGKLETKAISKLVEEIELSNVLERFLTTKDRDIYYKSKFRLRKLLNEGGD